MRLQVAHKQPALINAPSDAHIASGADFPCTYRCKSIPCV